MSITQQDAERLHAAAQAAKSLRASAQRALPTIMAGIEVVDRILAEEEMLIDLANVVGNGTREDPYRVAS